MAEETKKPPTPREMKFVFEYDKDYRIVAANGVWGGVTPRGEINIDFFVERQRIPEWIKNEISDDGHLGGEIERKPEKMLSRRLQVSVLLSAEQAKSLATFITDKIKEIEKAVGKK